MSTLTVQALRQRAAAALEAVSGWRESRWAYDAFPGAEPGQYAHQVFAVGVPSSEFDSPIESSISRRGGAGGSVETPLRVRWLWRLRADAMVADYDAALAGEALLYKALASMDSTGLHLSIATMTRRPVGDGTWLFGEIAAVAQHRLPLI